MLATKNVFMSPYVGRHLFSIPHGRFQKKIIRSFECDSVTHFLLKLLTENKEAVWFIEVPMNSFHLAFQQSLIS